MKKITALLLVLASLLLFCACGVLNNNSKHYSSYEELANAIVNDFFTNYDIWTVSCDYLPQKTVKRLWNEQGISDLSVARQRWYENGLDPEELKFTLDNIYGLGWSYEYDLTGLSELDDAMAEYLGIGGYYDELSAGASRSLVVWATINIMDNTGNNVDVMEFPIYMFQYNTGWGGQMDLDGL